MELYMDIFEKVEKRNSIFPEIVVHAYFPNTQDIIKEDCHEVVVILLHTVNAGLKYTS